ncbi:MAG: helix-turn-helix domain-containing protein [Patescibacteria group bacterium]|nr:helix-turn-helix domain-containing protein [Patescibacteria group bacterium]
MKYWNRARISRTREREARAKRRVFEKQEESKERNRCYTSGDAEKNADLMLHALGSSHRRKMVALLRRDGAMSVSKLAKPLRMTLSAALYEIGILERVRIITTHKRGRIRFCVYNPHALKELARWLVSRP